MRTLIFVICVSLIASRASANLLLYDGFDYTVGARIIGQTNTAASQSWSDPPTPAQPGPGAASPTSMVDPQVILDANLSYSGLPAPTGKSVIIPRGLGTTEAGGSTQSNLARISIPGGPYTVSSTPPGLFFSMEVQLGSFNSTSTSQTGGFMAGFTASGPSGGMSGASVYGGQLRFRKKLDGASQPTGDYEIGFNKNNQGTLSVVWDTTHSFSQGSTLFIVGQYEFGTSAVTDDTVRLWVNPVPGAAQPDPNVVQPVGIDVSTSSGTVQAGIASFWLRSDTATPGDLVVDELRIGTTYQDVTPSVPTVLVGDYNDNHVVDAGDYVTWRRALAGGGSIANETASIGTIDSSDYDAWRSNFGASASGLGAASSSIPEPTTAILMLLGLCGIAARRR